MTEIPKAYEPQSVEDKWYEFWVKYDCFTADPTRVSAKRPAYSIVIPPPNVTGVLHMGHVLNNTIQDILARKARMDGKEVLWLPGTDHAGIATEGMVAKQLRREEKKSKQDLGREEFIKRVWAWKEKHGGIIIAQLKKLGCSCDWTRERFTMDPEYVRCVQKVFVDLYKKGLVYRGKRMVNWCPATQTALSDEEVEMKPQKGFMYHFRVEVAEPSPGSPGEAWRETASLAEPSTDTEAHLWLTIATTRPETIPGDTAVAVNPKDPRYAHLIGRHIVRPLPVDLPRSKKLIPIVGDEHVDFEFGTGVLKVTPAHDKADFEIGQRHKLPIVDIMNPDGTMNALAGEALAGLDRFAARKIAVQQLRDLGALVDEKPYENNVGFSQRADVPIEPRLSEQWFLKYPAVAESQACVEQDRSADLPIGLPADSQYPGRSGDRRSRMRFHPQRWAKVYDHWLTNIQDWCISRQLWWGHRVPVWYPRPGAFTAAQLEQLKNSPDDSYDELVSIEEGVRPIWISINPPPEPEKWVQDSDVLDTWFSSWLWPFATMGWTDDEGVDAKNPTLTAFYPTSDLVTAPEIIFFWVARMIIAGFEYMGEMPFRDVYFTGIVRDKQGRKMSKSLGNSPDPLDLIAKYGADAIRFGTMRSAPLGQDVMFDEKDVELGRNFCNKLWNACRFRQMQGSGSGSGADIPPPPTDVVGNDTNTGFEAEINPALLTSDDKWILLRLDQAIHDVSDALASYNFAIAVQSLYRFFWSEYCDWYVEASKAALGSPEPGNQNPKAALRANKLAVIDFVLGNTLRLFHPFLPFITEELWHGMGFNRDLPADQGGRTIMCAPWPKPLTAEEKLSLEIGDDQADDVYRAESAIQKLVYDIRAIRNQSGIHTGQKLKLVLHASHPLPQVWSELICQMVNAEPVQHVLSYHPAQGTPVAYPASGGKLFVPLAGLVDVGAERARLTKELERIRSEIKKVEEKLANPNFTQKVPAKVLEEHRQRLMDWQAKEKQAQTALENLPE